MNVVDQGNPSRHAIRQIVLILMPGVFGAFEEVHRLDRFRFILEAIGQRSTQTRVDQEIHRLRVVQMLIERTKAIV